MNLSTGQSKSADASFILIAEDNPADVGLIRMALTRHGIVHDVRILPDGEAALHFIEQVEADESARCPLLAVLDLNLPRVSGDQGAGSPPIKRNMAECACYCHEFLPFIARPRRGFGLGRHGLLLQALRAGAIPGAGVANQEPIAKS